MGVNNVAANSPAMLGIGVGTKLPRVTPKPPHVGGPSLVSVNKVALVQSGLNRQGSFVFLKDSAGMGIPRNELGSLKGFSKHADERGIATTPIYMSTMRSSSNGMRGASMRPAPVAIHRGYSPYGGYSGSHSGVGASNSTSPAISTSSSISMSSAHSSGGGGRH